MWLLLACAPVAEPDPVEFSSMPQVVEPAGSTPTTSSGPVFFTTTTVSFDDPICSEVVPASPVVPCALAPDPARVAACGDSAALVGEVGYDTVQEALDAAAGAVEVCPGTWSGATVSRDVVLAAVDPTPGATVLDGGLQIDAAATIRGLTVRGGPAGGAAIEASAPGVHLDCVTVEGNDGTAVSAAGEITLTASTIRENRGGGVVGGPVIAHDTVFESNSVGGAAVIVGDSALTRCWFAHNVSAGDGGAVTWSGGRLTVADTVFHCNDAAGEGGALTAVGDVVLERSTLSSNVATAGGAVAAQGASFAAVDVVVERNVARASGGAMSLVAGAVELVGVTVADNRAPHAAAIELDGALVGEGLVVVRNLADDAAVTLSPSATLDCAGCDFGLGLDDNRPTDAIKAGAAADQLGASFSL